MNRILPLALMALAAPFPATAQLEDDGDDAERIYRSVEGFSKSFGERGSATAQQLKEQRTRVADTVSKPRNLTATLTASNAWIFDADAVLYDDLDDDGYYRFLSVRFDADTYLPGMYVYATLYLSDDGETWEHYYTTEDFLIDGTVPDDEYFVETELLQGYPPGLYDVLIELYDADFDTFEDEFGPQQTSALGLLPIEDAAFDAAPIQVSVSNGNGGGGAASPWMTPLLLGLAGLLHRRRRARAIVCR